MRGAGYLRSKVQNECISKHICNWGWDSDKGWVSEASWQRDSITHNTSVESEHSTNERAQWTCLILPQLTSNLMWEWKGKFNLKRRGSANFKTYPERDHWDKERKDGSGRGCPSQLKLTKIFSKGRVFKIGSKLHKVDSYLTWRHDTWRILRWDSAGSWLWQERLSDLIVNH